MEALEQNDFEKTASIALNYYDKTYDYSITQREGQSVKRIAFEMDDVTAIAEQLIGLADKKI